MDLPQRIFITGTDTGVGKTVVTAAISSCLIKKGIKVTCLKPFQTGTEDPVVHDIEFIYKVINKPFDTNRVCPFRLRKPLSPYYASKLENISYRIPEVIEIIESRMDKDGVNLVEGAGGIRVPIMKNYFMSDLAKDLGLALLIVARPGLGTINHTLLTIDHAMSCGLKVLGVVISNYPRNPELAARTNISQLRELLGVEILGIVPALESVNVERGWVGSLNENSHKFFVKELGGILDMDNVNDSLTEISN